MNLADYCEKHDRSNLHTRDDGAVFVDVTDLDGIDARLDLFGLSDYAVTTAAAAGCYWLSPRRPATSQPLSTAAAACEVASDLTAEDLATRLPRRLRPRNAYQGGL